MVPSGKTIGLVETGQIKRSFRFALVEVAGTPRARCDLIRSSVF